MADWRGWDTWKPHKVGQEEAEGLEWALRVTGGEESVGRRSRELYLVWKKPECIFHTKRWGQEGDKFKVREMWDKHEGKEREDSVKDGGGGG